MSSYTIRATHHEDGLAEIISKINLRQACKLRDGAVGRIVFTD